MVERKSLKELTLLDKFLFDEVIDNPEAREAMLRIIFEDENYNLLDKTQTEKELRTAPWLRSIRLDVFSIDKDNRIINTEMQQKFREDLIKRSRFYQGLIDSSLLEPGITTYNLLNDTVIILITPFDLFGENRYKYTFVTKCVENESVPFPDGCVKIFLNTRGANDNETNPELIKLLHYIEDTNSYEISSNSSDNLLKLQEIVQKVQASEEIGVKYMQKWEEEIMLREEEKDTVTKDAIEKTIKSLKKYNVSKENILKEITDSYPNYTEYAKALI